MTSTNPFKGLNMDINQQQTFVRIYFNLPEKSASTVRFFSHTDFYSVHEDDAHLAAEFLNNLSLVHTIGEHRKLKYVCLSKKNFENFLRDLLLIKQYRVEVYEKSGQSNNDWILEYRGSPGNLQQFEKILFENEETFYTSSVMGIQIGKVNSLNIVGVACVDSTEGLIHVGEFIDNEFFTDLEAIIAQVCPKECVIQMGESQELTNLKKVLERNGVLVVRNKKSEFNENDIEQDLNRLLYFAENQQRNCQVFPELEKHNAMCCLQVVIKYLNLIGQEQNSNQYTLKSLDMNKRVRLDNAAIYALNIFNKNSEIIDNKFETVYGVMNNCSTSQGKRLLQRWIKQPYSDINILTERLNVVEALVADSENRNQLSKYSLSRIPELLLLAKKIGSKNAKLQDCYRIYQAVTNIPALIHTLKKVSNPSVKDLLIDPITEVLNDFEKFQSMIEQTLDLDLVDRGEFFIKASFDPDLGDLLEKKREVEERMQKLLKKAANDLDFEAGKNIKLECNDQHGYFFRVTLKEEPILRKNNHYEIIDAVKGGVRFTTSKLQELNTDYSEINSTYERQQKEVVEEILNVTAGYSNSLKNLNMCIATIDVLVSMATTAANAPIAYVRPKLLPTGSGILRLKKARHPCLERQEGINFIPNDVDFVKDEKVLHVITGPNMCGKSTYMRTIGVNVLLAHIGSFVACDEAEISVVDCILTRVGADDSELKGMSTFMMEMVETCGIVMSATDKSFVIIDELGRGTSTYDGCGIASSIVEYLAVEVKAFTLFATHYHEITKLEEEIPAVSNLHVTVITSEDKITPLYQIREGVCDKSYGIHCAKVAGIDEEVIEEARKFQERLENTHGMTYIKDYEYEVKKKIIDEGDSIISNIINQLSSDQYKNLSENDLSNKLEMIKKELILKDNPFVKGLIGV